MVDYEDKTTYFVTCGSPDEDGEWLPDITEFDRYDNYWDVEIGTIEHIKKFYDLSDECYTDNKGFIHEIYDGVDEVFGKYIDDINYDIINQLTTDMKELGIPEGNINRIIEIADEFINCYERTLYFISFGTQYKDGSKSPPGICRIGDCTNANTRNIERTEALKLSGENAYIDDKGFTHIVLDDVDQIDGKFIDDVDENTVKQLETDMRALGVAEDLITEIIKEANGNAEFNARFPHIAES